MVIFAFSGSGQISILRCYKEGLLCKKWLKIEIFVKNPQRKPSPGAYNFRIFFMQFVIVNKNRVIDIFKRKI